MTRTLLVSVIASLSMLVSVPVAHATDTPVMPAGTHYLQCTATVVDGQVYLDDCDEYVA